MKNEQEAAQYSDNQNVNELIIAVINAIDSNLLTTEQIRAALAEKQNSN